MTDWIEPTTHAYRRWRQRARDASVGPVVAWTEAVPIPDTHGLEADEVRYHPRTETVLLRKDTALVTVIDVPSSTNQSLRATVGQLRDRVNLEG